MARSIACALGLLVLIGCDERGVAIPVAGAPIRPLPMPEPTICDLAANEGEPRIVQIAAADHTACAMTNTGHLYCWGSDMYATGVMGNPELLGTYSCEARRAPEHRCLKQIAVGGFYGCGLTHEDRVLCWGSAADGVLGNPGATGGPYPSVVQSLENVALVSTGSNASAALLTDGTLMLWGRHLPHGEPVIEAPVEVFPRFGEMAAVAKWGIPRCAVQVGGQVVCWAAPHRSQTGDIFTYSVEPPAVVGAGGAIEVAHGYLKSCALTARGTITCWGLAPLGDDTENDSLTPVSVKGIDSAITVAVFASHACAVLVDGAVMCWGDNVMGECGQQNLPFQNEGDIVSVLVPMQVRMLPPAVQVATGWNFTCALTVDSEVYCWGSNLYCPVGLVDADGSDSFTHIPQRIRFPEGVE